MILFIVFLVTFCYAIFLVTGQARHRWRKFFTVVGFAAVGGYLGWFLANM